MNNVQGLLHYSLFIIFSFQLKKYLRNPLILSKKYYICAIYFWHVPKITSL